MSRPLPVLVGAGQITDRPDDPRLGLEPLALMEAAARRAFEDAALAGTARQAVDTVAVVTNVFHDYGDTARMLATRLGLHPARTILSTWGGNTPQSLLSHLCDEIAAGRIEVALLAGAEAFQTMRALGKAGVASPWTPPSSLAVPRWGESRPGVTEIESQHGAREAYVSFALFENAFRAARGQSLDDQRAELGAFGERCARVAASNPYAWFRDAKDATTLTTVTPSNRMVAFPYPKYLNAIMEVNQGAALLVTSEAAARRLGVPQDRLVYPWAAADVAELWFLSERANFHELPGMRRAARELLEAVDLELAAVRHLDLYGCFPIAPRLSAAMLGLDPATTRPLTVTGALPWFGGPGNDYATHAIAATMERLRSERDAHGLIHALGWNFTKHALAVYGGAPPPRGWQRAGGEPLQRWVESQARPVLATEPAGRGTLETYTVVHGRDGDPERGVAIGRLEDGQRFVAVLPKDRAVLAALETDEGVGRDGVVRTAGGLSTFEPRS
jgi:acetyl-CoA C-acetyltransferase